MNTTGKEGYWLIVQRLRPGLNDGEEPSAIESSSRSGNRIASWRFTPWVKTMQVQPSERAKKFLIVVSSAIVYQDMAFSHSLALHLTASSVRSCVTPASGSR